MERSTMLLMGKSTINGTQEKRAPKYSQSPHPRLHPPPCEGWCQWSTARRKPKNSADPRGWADRSYWLEKFWMFPSLAYIHPSEVLGGYGRIFFLLWSDVFFWRRDQRLRWISIHCQLPWASSWTEWWKRDDCGLLTMVVTLWLWLT